MGCDVTGDEARDALDPRLLDVCRQWLSMVEEAENMDHPPLDLHELVPRGNRLLRLAYEAGARRVVESWTQAGITNCVTELGTARRCK
jgi:hypothetical protein